MSTRIRQPVISLFFPLLSREFFATSLSPISSGFVESPSPSPKASEDEDGVGDFDSDADATADEDASSSKDDEMTASQ